MSTVEVSTDIAAPVGDVWATIMDPDRLKDWVSIHRSVDRVSSRPLTNGSTMEQVLSLHGVSFRVHWTLVDVKEPSAARWEGRGPAGSRARITYLLNDDGDGGTRFQYTNDFSPPGGKLGLVASRVLVGAASQREAEKSLQRLKALVERK